MSKRNKVKLGGIFAIPLPDGTFRGGNMFGKYMKYNLKLSPAYLVLALIFIGGIILTGDRETYFYDMAAVILQITLILMLPNLIYLIRLRKEQGCLRGFVAMVMVIPIPFTLIAIIMRIIYI